MSRFRNWKWVAGFILLLSYLGITLVVFTANVLNTNTQVVTYPTAEPTPDITNLITHTTNQKRWIQTLYLIEQTALQTGWTAELYRRAGDAWWNMGDIARAIPYWTSALESIDDVDLLRTVANSYIQLGEWTQARQTINKLLDLKPDDEWSNYQMGMILAPFNPVKSSLFFDAIPLDSPYAPQVVAIKNELSQKPDDPLISFRVGLLLVNFGMWDYAELAFQHASDVSYPNPQALAYLGWVKSSQGKDGSSWINQASQLAPQDAEVWYLRSLHFRAQADYVESLDAIAQSVRLAPENSGLYAELGTAFRLVGDVEQAEFWLDYAVSTSANTPEYQQILENFYIETAYVSPSNVLESLAEKASVSDSPDLLSAYGWALHSSGDSIAGLEQIDLALESNPTNPRALLDKAKILIDLDRQPEAIPLLERVSQTYTPFGTEATDILAGIPTE